LKGRRKGSARQERTVFFVIVSIHVELAEPIHDVVNYTGAPSERPGGGLGLRDLINLLILSTVDVHGARVFVLIGVATITEDGLHCEEGRGSGHI
jgi:hypothetical protein